MRARPGFTVIEAAVAMVIVGLAVAGLLMAFGGQLRGAAHAENALVVATLAEQRLAALQLLPADQLVPLADSLRTGRFESPFDAYGWTATTRADRNDAALIHAQVAIDGPGTPLALKTRLYRPRRMQVLP